ncbi:MAG: FAD-dependent oxidoreductase [Anaerolineae bacterium]|nr:FAD-dependent oxidoreductase [Anaerolineae bacterium]
MMMPFNLSQPDPYDVVIIGGGPAGASAAIYAARADLRTLVIDKGLTAGALGITGQISNYPGVPGPVGGAELVAIMRTQAESFGAQFVADKVVGLDLSGEVKTIQAGMGTYYAKAVILATGSMGRTASVAGEQALLGRGVSYCATCDGAFFRGKEVAVVGNNDEAVEEALFLAKFASKITLVVPTPELKASSHLLAELSAQPTIESRLATRLLRVEGADHVERVVLRSRMGSEESLPVAGVFIYLQGGKPIIDYLMGQLETTPEGCLRVDREMQTSAAGVFAVGDLLCSHVKQAVIASADGVVAAIAAEKFLHGHKVLQPDWH